MNNSKTIEAVVKGGLCTGCGTCVGVCPTDAVEMVIDYRKGIYVPLLDREKCNDCGLCYDVCPGHAVDFKQLNLEIFGKELEDILLGNYLNCYMGHATDYSIRYNSASGGLITALLIFALEEGLIDGALVTKMSEDRPLEPQPFIARTKEEIISAARSKYCPVPANIALKEILKAKDGKFAVVGLPCHIHGIRKAEMVNRKLKEKIVLHFGILCAHSDRFSETEFILQKYGIKKENVAQLDYRGQGWPGYMTIRVKDGIGKSIYFFEYITFHVLYLFAPERCTLCSDAICKLADITFMDAWLPEVIAEDRIGKSIIVSRTEAGEALCRRAKSKQVICIDEITSDEVLRSQGKMQISNKDLKANFYLSRLYGSLIPNYNTSLPQSGPINYLRALVIHFNVWASSKGYLRKFINPLVYLESGIGRWVKSKI